MRERRSTEANAREEKNRVAGEEKNRVTGEKKNRVAREEMKFRANEQKFKDILGILQKNKKNRLDQEATPLRNQWLLKEKPQLKNAP